MKTNTEQAYKERLLRVLVHIQNHLDEAVSLDELAAIANFSPFHFHRVFRGMTGEGVMEHCRRLRLERAGMRLRHSTQPVTQIAFEAGYETLDAFIKAFRNRFGMSPTAFRRAMAYASPPAPPSGVVYDPEGDLRDFNPIKDGAWTMEVEVKTVQKMKIAFVRHVGPFDDPGLSQAWQKLFAWAGPRGLLGPQMTLLGVGYGDPEVTPPEKLRYDASIVLTREVEPEGEIGVQEISGGEYASAVHKGPYEKLKDTYVPLIGQWIPAHGYEMLPRPSFEIYRNSPDRTPADELITEIYVPVARAG